MGQDSKQCGSKPQHVGKKRNNNSNDNEKLHSKLCTEYCVACWEKRKIKPEKEECGGETGNDTQEFVSVFFFVWFSFFFCFGAMYRRG